MPNPFKRKLKPYVAERDRLLEWLAAADPTDDDYAKVMQRLNELDRLINRASETKKALIPAAGSIVAIGGVYALQQFGGVLVPKALERIDLHREQRKSQKDD